MLFKKAIELYLEQYMQQPRSEKTIKSYKAYLNGFNNYLNSRYNCQVYVEDITVADFKDYLQYLLVEKEYAEGSRHNVITIARLFFNYCCEQGHCKENIAMEVEQIKLKPKERTFLSENEVHMVFDQCKIPLAKTIIQTLYYTGIRISESIDLTLDDVDFDKKVIHVIGKGGKYRCIPMSQKLELILRAYLQNWRLQIDSKKLFCTEYGSFDPNYLSKWLKRAVKAAGIQRKVTAHTMRHSFSSNLINKGVDIVRVQKLLGHSNILTTMIYYGKKNIMESSASKAFIGSFASRFSLHN